MSPQNEDYGPGLLPAFLLAVLTFFIGMVLGTASMVSKEVRTLNRNANIDDLEPGTVYYITGDRSRATGWEAKEQALISGLSGTLTLSEGDLNQWSTRRLKIETPAAADESGWMDKLEISADPLEFRIVDDQLVVTAKLKMPGLLGNRTFLYQVHGDFMSEGGAIHFQPVKGTLGCAPLGEIPGIREFLFETVISLYGSTDPGNWLPQVLPQIASAQVADGELFLRGN